MNLEIGYNTVGEMLLIIGAWSKVIIGRCVKVALGYILIQWWLIRAQSNLEKSCPQPSFLLYQIKGLLIEPMSIRFFVLNKLLKLAYLEELPFIFYRKDREITT